MSTRIAELAIKIGADEYQFTEKMKAVEKRMKQVSKNMVNFGKNMTAKVSGPLAALGAVSVKLADTQAKAEAKVQQAIKSTAGAAGLSFEQLKSYASELQGQTLFGDEKILNEATAQLLTFTNLAGENFKRAQAAALDLSTMFDGDLKSSAIGLGKALNDPVTNLSALSKKGIQFSADQKAVIKALAETNRLSEAQSIILTELERQYGGQAAAAAETGLGKIQQQLNRLSDCLEGVGERLQPVVDIIASAIEKFVDCIVSMSPGMQTTIVVAAGLVAAIGPLSIVLGGAISLLPALASGLSFILGPVGLLSAAVIGLAAAWGIAKGKHTAYLNEVSDGALTKARKLSDEDLQKEIDYNKSNIERLDNYGTVPNVASKIGYELGWERAGSIEQSRQEYQAKISACEKVLQERAEEAKLEKEMAEMVAVTAKAQKEFAEQQKKLTAEGLIPGSEPTEIKTNSYVDNLDYMAKGKKTGLEVDASLGSISSSITKHMSGINEARQKYAEGLMETMNLAAQLDSMTANMFGDLATTFASGIGEAMVGDLGLEDMLNNIQTLLGNFVASIGKIMIQTGIKVGIFEKLIKGAIKHPALLVAGGIALVAFGSAMAAKAQEKAQQNTPRLAKGGIAYGETLAMVGDNPNASIDPEVIAPLSKLKSIIGEGSSSGRIDVHIHGKMSADSRGLSYVIEQEVKRMKLIRS